MYSISLRRILCSKLDKDILFHKLKKVSSFSTVVTGDDAKKKPRIKKTKKDGSAWEKMVINKLSREYEQHEKEREAVLRHRELLALSVNYIMNADIKHLFGTATNYVNLLKLKPKSEPSEEYLAVVLKYASVILQQAFDIRPTKAWNEVIHYITNFLSRVHIRNNLSAMGYMTAHIALNNFVKMNEKHLNSSSLSEILAKCEEKATLLSRKYDFTEKQLLFDVKEVIKVARNTNATKNQVMIDSYDPNLYIVDGLKRGCQNLSKDSPFVIEQRSREDYIKAFVNQLEAEKGGYLKVENFVRDTNATPIEDMIKEWKWKEKIKEKLEIKSAEVQDALLKKSLANVDMEECATGMLDVIHAELSQGLGHISIPDFEHALSQVVLNRTYLKFLEQINVSPGEVTRDVYQQFIEYFCNPVISQRYTARQWWKLCCTSQNVDSSIALPYTDFKYFMSRNLGGFLSEIVSTACVFPHPGRHDFCPALSYSNVKIQSDSILMEEKKTKVTKMLCVHQYIMNLIKDNGFKHLLFPQSRLPMCLPPRPWMDLGKNGPFYTFSSDIIRRLEDYGKVHVNKEFLKRLPDETSARPVFDALNDLGSTPWIINNEMLDVLHHVFTMCTDATQKELLMKLSIPLHASTQVVPEFTSVFGEDATAADITSEQWREFYKEKVQAVKTKYEMNSLWCWLRYRITLALHYRNNVLFFPHNMDFRGRVYPISPYLNHMGDDINRCILKFAKGKRLGSRGLYWLKLHIINITGLLKKKSISDRVKYFEEHLDDILDSANNPLAGRRWWLESDDPWQTLAACKELKDALKLDNPEDFISHLPIHQDGSCNGLQHYAALGRDRQGALEVNLCPADVPADIYSSVAARVEQRRIEDEKDETSPFHQVAMELRQALPEPVPRKVVKQTVMTTVYGVTEYGARQQIKKQLKALAIDSETAARYASYLTEKTFESLTEAFSTSMQIKEWLRDCSLVCYRLMKPVEWTTPLGMPVMQPYLDVAPKLKNTKICRVPVRHKQINAFPPNYIHSLDSTHMMLTALYCHQQGITFAAVHDCYWTHASSVDLMNKICREQFVEMYKQPLIENLAQEMQQQCLPAKLISKMNKEEANEFKEKLTPKFEFGELNIEDVKDSVYFFS